MLTGVCMLTACSDDNGSNPTLVQPAEGSFEAFAPEFQNQDVVLEANKTITLTWNQPTYTNKGVGIGYYEGSGSIYEINIALADKFTNKYDADKVNEDGTYGAENETFDYVQIDEIMTTTKADVLTSSIDRAVNILHHYSANPWTEETELAAEKIYVQVISKVIDGAGKVLASAKSNTISFNVLPYYIDLNAKSESYLWVPGNGNGWNHGVAPVLVDAEGKGVYSGYAYMDGEFKFTEVDHWDKELNNGSFESASTNIDLGAGDGGNLGFTGAPGMYFITVDMANKTVGAVPFEWGVIGSFNDWKTDTYAVMTYNTDAHCLEADVTLSDGDEWKFTSNRSWDTNFGGSLGALEYGAGNITGVSGTKVQLYIERPGQDGFHAVVK